jgi:micrococcal nuclease
MVLTTETVITGTVVAIVNGATLAVLAQGTLIRVRLYGIETPKPYQVFGRRAKRFLGALAWQQEVTVTVRDIDRDGGVVGEVWLADGRHLSQALVQAGLAWHAAQEAPQDTVLQQLQAEAQAAQRGLWRAPHHVLPWAMRRERAP